jgi:Tfp pilus assembly protein PilX
MSTRNENRTIYVANEDGFVLLVALMTMVILSIIGISALNTTDIELQIAGNDRLEKQIFYGTESGCTRGGQWLRNLQLAVIDDYVDSDLMTTYISEQNFSKAMSVHNVSETDESNLGNADYPVKYSYGIQESEDTSGNRMICRPIPGNNPNILDCYYDVVCSTATATGGGRSIDIQVAKPTDFE